jgi:predicted N-acetyltransferase YhbS
MTMDVRPAASSDIDAICELLVGRLDEEDGPEARMILEADGPHDWWVGTVDGEIGSTMMVHPVSYRIGSVTVPGNQVEFVATHERFAGRGLVRRQFEAATESMARRGELISMIVGIPYFYRRFGYEYAVSVPDVQVIRAGIELPTDETLGLADATLDDVSAVQQLQALAQESADVAASFPDDVRSWFVRSPNYRTVIARRAETPVGMVRAYEHDGEVWVFEVVASQPEVLGSLLDAVRGNGDVGVLHRPASPAGVFIGSFGETSDNTEAYYGKVLDVEALLNALRPTFDQRLAEAGLDDLTHTWMLSTYVASYGAEIVNGSFGPITTGPGIQAPASKGGSGVPPDLMATMIVGRDGITELNRWHGDVYLGKQAAIMDALFPPQEVDILTWIVP